MWAAVMKISSGAWRRARQCLITRGVSQHRMYLRRGRPTAAAAGVEREAITVARRNIMV
jgi:hypothetical protein